MAQQYLSLFKERSLLLSKGIIFCFEPRSWDAQKKFYTKTSSTDLCGPWVFICQDTSYDHIYLCHDIKYNLIIIKTLFLTAECNKNITQASSPEGTICSPRYSHPYPADITCTYDFYANPGERVQIKFTHFNLYKSQLYTEGGWVALHHLFIFFFFLGINWSKSY